MEIDFLTIFIFFLKHSLNLSSVIVSPNSFIDKTGSLCFTAHSYFQRKLVIFSSILNLNATWIEIFGIGRLSPRFYLNTFIVSANCMSTFISSSSSFFYCCVTSWSTFLLHSAFSRLTAKKYSCLCRSIQFLT